MKKYLIALRLGWLDSIEYRTEFFISIAGWSIRLFVSVFLWRAVSSTQGGTIGPYTFQNILIYFFIIQIISTFVFARVGFDIARDIYRGDIANFLLKPINYLGMRFLHEVSKNGFRTIIAAGLFGSIIFLVLGGISLSFAKIALFFIAIILSCIINFCLVSCLALTGFWVTSSHRFMFIYFGILVIFSGMMVPIDLFPPTLAQISSWLPFQYIFFLPAHIMQMPQLNVSEITPLFLKAVAYTGLLVPALILFYRRGVRHFEAVGR